MGFRLMKSESETDRLFRETGTGNVFLFNISFCVCGAPPCATRGRIFREGGCSRCRTGCVRRIAGIVSTQVEIVNV